MSSSLEKTWKFIGGWDRERMAEQKEIWFEINAFYDECAQCQRTAVCPGCSRAFCKHTKSFICESEKRCHWCDSVSQPFASNPKNRRYILEYCPERLNEI
ncbi:hypothetical protein [Kurlavirus BKC-1]|nr:hypothetical protein [Kurlavirus BKC-1]